MLEPPKSRTGESAISTVPESGFRPEIQALRAVAVALVVVFHVWPSLLPGGYVGVDVFFVISGYLITAHLLREVEASGRIRLAEFWARRVRRLLPAAFLVLVVAFVATVFVMPWDRWMQGLREVMASAFYVENWVLAADSVDYLAAENVPTLVQHFWSLSVEEQFYILWPLVILAALWIARRGVRAGVPDELKVARRRRAVATALVLVLVASIVVSVSWTIRSPSSAYFSTVTRAWEFAAGGLLAFVPALARVGLPRGAETVVHLVASWGGLILIVFSAATYSEVTPFPGVAAAVPVLGALAVMWARESSTVWSPTLLGRFGPVQFVGDISYSVYLWHWPLVLLYPLLRGNAPEFKGGLLIIAGALVCGWLSKTFVEDPFRRSAFWRPRVRSFAFSGVGMAVVACLALAGTSVINSEIAKASATRAPYTSVAQIQDGVVRTLQAGSWQLPDQAPGRDAQSDAWVVDGCIDITTAEDRERCVYGNLVAEETVVVIGDSYATQFLAAIEGAFGGDYRIQPLTLGQCPVVDVPVRKGQEPAEFTMCAAHNAEVQRLVQQIDPALLIVADSTQTTLPRMLQTGAGEERNGAYLAGAARAYERISDLGVDHVVVLEAAPGSNCYPENRFSSPADCRAPGSTLELRDLQRGKLDAASAVGLATIDTATWLCSKDGRCPDQIGSALVRADHAHLTQTFSATLSEVLRNEIQRVTGLN